MRQPRKGPTPDQLLLGQSKNDANLGTVTLMTQRLLAGPLMTAALDLLRCSTRVSALRKCVYCPSLRGDVDAARRFFERAADIGLSQGAMALATTYDPNELAKLKIVGLQANAAAARKWYDRAAELGAAEAGDRLRRLGAR